MLRLILFSLLFAAAAPLQAQRSSPEARSADSLRISDLMVGDLRLQLDTLAGHISISTGEGGLVPGRFDIDLNVALGRVDVFVGSLELDALLSLAVDSTGALSFSRALESRNADELGRAGGSATDLVRPGGVVSRQPTSGGGFRVRTVSAAGQLADRRYDADGRLTDIRTVGHVRQATVVGEKLLSGGRSQQRVRTADGDEIVYTIDPQGRISDAQAAPRDESDSR